METKRYRITYIWYDFIEANSEEEAKEEGAKTFLDAHDIPEYLKDIAKAFIFVEELK